MQPTTLFLNFIHNKRFLKGDKQPVILLVLLTLMFGTACKEDKPAGNSNQYPAIATTFQGKIDPANLPDYAGQTVPAYITKDNGTTNPITNEKTTLGRVLFYDNKLSVNNQISCSSCHKQAFAFGDTAKRSVGVAGLTGRHSMRLINTRFSTERKFFWDERAASLEDQTTQPIQDHVEMGYSGTNGDPSFGDLRQKLSALPYYQELFKLAFGDATITEARMQIALAQFVRSIQSFDSKYDAGRATGTLDGNFFPNFTEQENMGKRLFVFPLGVGGASCGGCHLPPEFDIAPAAGNNGVIGVAGSPGETDLTNTRSPTLRDVFNSDGTLNGPLMHDASFTTIEQVIEHYNQIMEASRNPNLDPRLMRENGSLQSLELREDEKAALIAFLKTLSGSNVYTDEKYGSPFPE
jgi:cytochrome c peroxidase